MTLAMPGVRRVTLAYIVYFTSLGASFPYLPVFYRQSLHLDLAAVGSIAAAQAAMSLLAAPLWGGLADRFPRSPLTHPVAAFVAAAGAAVLLSLAVWFGSTRLIDNEPLG